MLFTLVGSRLGLRNSTTRLPFRYGNTCLTRCPQAVLEVTIETGSRRQAGYSGDCLPPGWFDKTPGCSFRQQIEDMLAVIRLAGQAFADEAFRPCTLFACWLAAYRQAHRKAAELGFNPLLASFGVSFYERAIMDALARACGLSFAEAVRENVYGIEPGLVHPELNGLAPADWLPARPRTEVYVRQTVGLSDPLTTAEIAPADRRDDGFPQSLEQYIRDCGVRYFKLKLANEPQRDRQRLLTLAGLAQQYLGADYRVTLDGNEQYKQAADFESLSEMLSTTPGLQTLLANTLVIEQPLERSIALDPNHTSGVRALGRFKPVIIDESDGELDSYKRAIDVGYRGVSSKNCKGPIKALLNAGLTWLRNDRGKRADYVMTGEDLCSVGIIPTQADLCLAATLGLEHVERNGHHYHPGLTYLPPQQREAALAAHGDFYALQHGVVAPVIRDGKFHIGSLHNAGFGFSVVPDLDAYEPADEWRYESLGLAD